MEITNRSRFHSVYLVVGRRYGQVVFFQTDELEQPSGDHYAARGGKYQSAEPDLKTLISKWNPHMMLPRMHMDRETRT